MSNFNIPKMPLDLTAFLTSLAALAGYLTTLIGLIGVTLSAIWSGYRLYDYLKNRKK